jgi:hypothetical protein
MLTKTKIALAAALVASSASVALAQDFDPNPAAVRSQHQKVRLHSAPVLQQREVALPSADTSAHAGPFWYGSSGPTTGGM